MINRNLIHQFLRAGAAAALPPRRGNPDPLSEAHNQRKQSHPVRGGKPQTADQIPCQVCRQRLPPLGDPGTDQGPAAVLQRVRRRLPGAAEHPGGLPRRVQGAQVTLRTGGLLLE